MLMHIARHRNSKRNVQKLNFDYVGKWKTVRWKMLKQL